jgi:hypothetical protein
MSNARCAPRDPLSVAARSFPREAAVNAVSDPEKNADNMINPPIEAEVIQKAASKTLV